jgi:mannose-6-phosphate isomerase-like protein (cupin superfamily)
MSRFFEVDALEWQPVRPDVAHEVFGKTLLADGVRMTLTRVAPGGGFYLHEDDYGHLFYFLAGTGIVRIGEDEFPVRPGTVVQVAAGESHTYVNMGTEELLLISVNLPSAGKG